MSSCHAQVIYEYTAQANDQLTITEGEIVTIIGTSNELNGWALAQKGDDAGYIPATYVRLIDNAQIPTLMISKAIDAKIKPKISTQHILLKDKLLLQNYIRKNTSNIPQDVANLILFYYAKPLIMTINFNKITKYILFWTTTDTYDSFKCRVELKYKQQFAYLVNRNDNKDDINKWDENTQFKPVSIIEFEIEIIYLPLGIRFAHADKGKTVCIHMVLQNGTGCLLGLLPGDILTAVNGMEVLHLTSVAALQLFRDQQLPFKASFRRFQE